MFELENETLEHTHTGKATNSKSSLIDSFAEALGDFGVDVDGAKEKFVRVLSIEACQQTLARELIPLYAQMLNADYVKDLEKGGNLRDMNGETISMNKVLHNLMESPSKDYITRTLLTYVVLSREFQLSEAPEYKHSNTGTWITPCPLLVRS